MLILGGLILVILLGVTLLSHWLANRGATREERRAVLPGDSFLQGDAPRRLVMTRAITLNAPPETVWPWLAQLGRGAGWYSVDFLDNGVESARHIVSWIPPPTVGDASAIGYLRHVDTGRGLAWWTPGVRFLGAMAQLVTDIQLREDGAGSRLVIRMSASAQGVMARPALFLFRFIDGIMATRQLRGIRERVHQHGARLADPDRTEDGRRDQFQRYEVIYASGERAGRPGIEHAARWRDAAVADGVVSPSGRALRGGDAEGGA